MEWRRPSFRVCQTTEVAAQSTENEGKPKSLMKSQVAVCVIECTAPCCSTPEKAFQPIDKPTLAKLSVKKRNFQPQWYKQFSWLTVCISSKKAYCLYFRHAVQHNLIMFSKIGEKAFTEDGFRNWRKALEKFKSHEGSHVHREAKLKWMARGKPTIESQISSQVAQQQSLRRQGLLVQLRAIVYLTRQGIAL